MDIYEEIKAWVEGVLGAADIDHLRHTPEAAGLFPQGVQVLRSWEDVVGQKKRRVRYSFLLRLILPPGDRAVVLLLHIQDQAARAGYAAADGKLKKAASDGLAIYEIRLSAEREEML